MTDNNNAFLRAFAAIARREERERVAKGLRVVRAARKAGLPVKRVTIDGVNIELGEPEPATGNELDQWIARQHDPHSLERH